MKSRIHAEETPRSGNEGQRDIFPAYTVARVGLVNQNKKKKTRKNFYFSLFKDAIFLKI